MNAQAVARAPYGRNQKVAVSAGQSQPFPDRYRGETYYGQPVLNPSHYGQLVATYLFIGGIGGASQMIATIADVCGREKNSFVVRAGRYLALGGALAGPAFLIADLHTPERWYNMLRIFRRTSAMSIGSWTLAGFGTLSAITAALQFLADRLRRPFYRRAAQATALPATAAGMIVATYTGTLLGSTSIPLWARASRRLPALFGISAAATSAAMLSLIAEIDGAPDQTKRRLEKFALITAGAELIASNRLEWRWERENLAGPIKQEPIASAYRLGYQGLGLLFPLIVHGLNYITKRRSERWSMVAAIATLAGGYLLRSIILRAGKESAQRPEDYFQITRPE
ncbi:MAG TPA: NrfD/PsrC family molybdoenzyme membrane anchor subunit [Candidatus Binatia bacterium]|jgi:formate-dependent nitrite reductase membrane component NrfD